MKEQLKIALFHNLPSGGAKRALYSYVDYLSRAGHLVEVFIPETANEKFLPLKNLIEHINVFLVKKTLTGSLISTLKYIPPAVKGVSFSDLEKTHIKIAEAINQGDYDVVFCEQDQYTMAPFLLKYLKKAHVYYCQQPLRNDAMSRVIFPGPRKNILLKLGSRMVVYRTLKIDMENFRHARYILCNSYFSRETVLRSYGLNNHVSYLGVDTNVFRPMDIPKEGQSLTDDYLLSVGTCTPEKGYEFVVDSLARIPSDKRIKFVIVANSGYPPFQKYLIKHAQDKGVEMEILKLVNDHDLVKFYNQAKLILYAPYLEPFGLVPLEAMACGTPVVAVKEGGVRETVVHGETGILTDRDEEIFSQEVVKLLSNPEKQRLMGKNAAKSVGKFWTLNDAGERLEAHLRQAVQRESYI
jgi:glycosyltransferase involved in cell wall biosynthesis